MPRRKNRDPLAIRLGQRLRSLRIEARLSLTRLVGQAKLSGQGYLSDVERGWSLPVVFTLTRLGQALEAELIDVINFPELGPRHRLLELMRHLHRVNPGAVGILMRQAERYLRNPRFRS